MSAQFSPAAAAAPSPLLATASAVAQGRVVLGSTIIGISREIPPVLETELFENYSLKNLISAIFDLGDSFFLEQKAKKVGRGPFSPLQRLSPSSSFKIDGKI